ncbi:MAG: hypothetical protein ACYDCL_21625 [Myxococcales bacterium]
MRRLWALLLCAAGCCKGPGVQGVSPSIEVQTSAGQALKSLAFADTAFGASAAQTFQVVSVADVDAHVTIALSGPAASLFSVAPSATSAVTVPASQSVTFTVTFAPQLPSPIPPGQVSDSATLTVSSDDPAHPTVSVPMVALAEAPRLDLCWADTPSSMQCVSDGGVTVQFGSFGYAADGGEQEVDVVDRSGVPLTVQSLALDAAAQAAGFSIVEQVQTPFTLSAASGEAAVLHLALEPKQSGALAGSFSVTADDPRLGGQPELLQLAATAQPPGKPRACLGIYQIGYADGTSVAPDPTRPLSAQPSIVPPGPLDTAFFTAEPSPTCSFDPQDGQAMAYQFTLAAPPGSAAALTPRSNDQQSVLFDLPGIYTVTLQATDSAGLSDTAQLQLLVRPHDDISAELTWQSALPVDLDLHLVRLRQPDGGPSPLSLVGDPLEDCYYANCLPAADYPPGSVPVVDWGVPDDAGVRDFDDPLLAAQFGSAPLNSEALDVANLSGPEVGADYDLFALYYNPTQGGQPGVSCTTSAQCSDPGFPACVPIGDAGECVPAATAQLDLFVEGTLLDAGAPIAFTLPSTCDLWWAGTLHWIASAQQLPDGGLVPPLFSFTPHTAADGGFLTVDGTPGAAGCVPP